ncbi:GNAT family N-acetyltransferase [Fulvivirgaceae bacterium BMA12]|uniref:GNAT family N-acetyltransferase n=1 Tax=Agaribacillus aureus TaxID=3051825 RepID=A0ABT8LHK1_9BACT|nr:GNAT family N-acetyltransferase [Fulvivirgaceae bacterium BMA12]
MQNTEIKQLTKHDLTDFQQLVVLFMEVFEHEGNTIPGAPYLKRLLARDDFIAFVVKIDDTVVGGLTAYELRKYYSEISEIFIYDIAVQPKFQRKGLGKRLLSALRDYCGTSKINEIFVAADQDDQQAVDFYHTTGGRAERVLHFNYLAGKQQL